MCSVDLVGPVRSYLYAVLLHGERSVDAVEFVVETTGIADRLPMAVSPPQRRRTSRAIGAGQSHSFRCVLPNTTLINIIREEMII